MIKEAKGTGATLEEARQNAIAALNASDTDDIQFDIISTGKKKFLGLFGGEPAEVRVYVELPDEKPKKRNPRPQRGRSTAEQAPKTEKKKFEKNAEKRSDRPACNAPKADKAAGTVKTEKAQAPKIEDETVNAVDISELSPDSQGLKAANYLINILTQLGCTNITAKVAEKENGAFVILDGDGLGVVIGHRGETLDALQYLAGLASNNGNGYFKVSLNIGNYREKREQTLISLAQRVSEQVLATGRGRALEPMNPYERRIIHTAVQEIEGVISGSVGEGNGRRVVIAPEGQDIHAPRGDRRNHSGHSNRSGHGRNSGHRKDRKPDNTVSTVPSREPKKDSDIPLYGKIN